MARHGALIGWQDQIQLVLDRCVARPERLRQATTLEVVFAPSATAEGPAPQLLSPVVVLLADDALRRLWQDTDPDALQGCLDQVRAHALSVPPPPKMPAQVLPVAHETLRVVL